MINRAAEDAFASILVDLARSAEFAPRMLPETFGPGGRYLLEELVGVGRDSHVYRAVDRHLSKPTAPALVAIKIRASGASARNEAIVGRSVVHENVVRVIDHGITEGGEPYVVQEWIGGGDLSDLKLPLTPRDAAELVAAIARGAQALHSAGNVHGDLKPSNVLRTEDGTPKVTDFDLASALDLDELNTGGNLAFMAPERLLDKPAPPSPLADIYSLGGLLYYFVTAHLPNGERAEEILDHHRSGAPVAMQGFEPDLAIICARALARDAGVRYRSAEALAHDLTLWLARRPIPWARPSVRRRVNLLVRRRPIQVLAGTLALVAACATVGWVQVSLQREVERQRRDLELSEAENEAQRLAYERRDAITRTAIRDFVSLTGTLVKDVENKSSVFSMLVYVDWISDLGLLGDSGPVIARDSRVKALVRLRHHYRESGQSGMLADSMAAVALAMTHLEAGDYEAAEPHVADAEAGLLALLPEHDTFRRSLEMLRELVEFERAVQTGELDTASTLREQLERRRSEALSDDGTDEVAFLVKLAFERHPE